MTGGTRVLSDRIVVRITAAPGKSFLDRMIALVEGAIRQRTPNEIALSLVLSAFTLIFLIVTATLWPMARYAEQYMAYLGAELKSLGTDIPTLVALLVCLIPTTIGALLAAIGIAGMDRALRANLIAKSGKAVEVAGDIDTLLLDKTGTITLGNRKATQFVPLDGLAAAEVGRLAALARSPTRRRRARASSSCTASTPAIDRGRPAAGPRFVEFTAQTRMSGVDLPDGRASARAPPTRSPSTSRTRAGRPRRLSGSRSTPSPRRGDAAAGRRGQPDRRHGRAGGHPQAGHPRAVRAAAADGHADVMVTGDNPLTAKAIAEQAGVDDYIAEATPEAKLAYIRKEQHGGKLVAMMGDGTNDAPALAQADIGVAMNCGTQAAKEAGNMVDLDSDPTKLIEVVEIGKQLLMTRGALTTFSIANDLAKYFAIVPALFVVDAARG